MASLQALAESGARGPGSAGVAASYYSETVCGSGLKPALGVFFVLIYVGVF
jgi:hypothetical protein